MGKLYRQVADLNRDYLERGGRREALERTVTFSIRLTESKNAKLKYLAGRFGAAKSPLAQQVLDAAMEESLTNIWRGTTPTTRRRESRRARATGLSRRR